MTSGTLDFLLKLPAKHKNINFFFLKNPTRTVAYYENEKKNIFAAGRKFESIITIGDLHHKGFVELNHIPVTDEGQPVFEDSFKKYEQEFIKLGGLKAFRLLKPKKGNEYIVFSQWISESEYDAWKKSDQYLLSPLNHSTKPPAYFFDKPFTASYLMYNPDEKK